MLLYFTVWFQWFFSVVELSSVIFSVFIILRVNDVGSLLVDLLQ